MVTKPMRNLLAVALAGCLVVLPGCKRLAGGNCHKPQAYALAAEAPPLRVPAGLDGPDTRAAMKIPALEGPEAPRSGKDPCLAEPPSATTPAAPAR